MGTTTLCSILAGISSAVGGLLIGDPPGTIAGATVGAGADHSQQLLLYTRYVSWSHKLNDDYLI